MKSFMESCALFFSRFIAIVLVLVALVLSFVAPVLLIKGIWIEDLRTALLGIGAGVISGIAGIIGYVLAEIFE